MRKTFYLLATLIIIASIVYLSLATLSLPSVSVSNIDKLQHGFAYAVLAFFFCMSLRTWGLNRAQYIITLLFCAFLGGVLEIVQSRYGRMMEFGDFAADVIGASLACSFIFLRDQRAA